MSELKQRLEVDKSAMQYRVDDNFFVDLPFENVDPCTGIIGQDRALSSVDLGLEIQSRGYNIFVTGSPGTGRTTAVKLLLQEAQKGKELHLLDICFVNNFKAADSPRALYFAAGEGRKFKKAISYLIESLVAVIPKVFSGENYRERRGRIVKEFETRQKDLFRDFEKKLKEKGFTLVQVQYGTITRPDLQPVIEGQTQLIADLEAAAEEGKFPAAELERIKAEYEELQKGLQESLTQSHKISSDLETELNRLDASLAVPVINDKIDSLKKHYIDPRVNSYLDDLHEILIARLDIFRGSNGDEGQAGVAAQMHEFFSTFTINLLVDNAEQKSRPIIVEDFPSFRNLFGSVEKIFDPSSGWHTDFTRIRGGSLIRANGGYLVLNVVDLFQDPYVWPTLKRTLRTGRLTITTIDPMNMTGTGLKPEALELDVKVILIGESRMYDLLFRADEEFKKTFKVKAEFDDVMTNDPENANHYVSFVKKIATENNLLPFDASALAALMEYGVRLTGRRDRLSTRFTSIADLLRESSWLARREKREIVDREVIRQARLHQKKRVDLIETKVHEMYIRELYLIDVSGWKVGQINGLSVYDLGEHAFGRPTRITASLSPGAAGVINIEREASLSGRTHDKGVLILSGFMRNRFGRKRPLVFTASLCFEQSYSGVDGDSASSTEIYALLSALSGKPINQALAVTGSVNQVGEIQPIGGVNEKIEGYFDTCRIKGLTGEQGVLVPRQNVPDLMLKDEVVEAVASGNFHIYAVGHVDEGIELLTGIPAGVMHDDEQFDEGSINQLADARLRELAEIWRQYIAAVR
jgi:lon-related putative ATP-dependent protease